MRLSLMIAVVVGVKKEPERTRFAICGKVFFPAVWRGFPKGSWSLGLPGQASALETYPAMKFLSLLLPVLLTTSLVQV